MRVVHGDEIPFTVPRTSHREGGIAFKHLLTGPAGAPDCYELSIARVETRYDAPRHRHNFDQVRWQLMGEFGDGKADLLRPGEVGYYGEGTYYTIAADGPSEQLLLQSGAPTGSGFMPYQALFGGAAELSKLGTFRDGVFFRDKETNLPPGVKRNQDGYEAVWQHVMGTPVVYPRPRFRSPVVMHPDAFAWLEDGPGVARRDFGRLTERGVRIGQIRVSRGGVAKEGGPARTLLYVLSGEGAADGQALRAGSAVEVDPRERLRLTSAGEMVLAVLTLPDFSVPAAMDRAAAA
ncbi:hypothetical protein ACE7GA_15535 [Roseomonas sp. CCTCC AB2023176]|uniref:hypothetical protein n=1 Tax=Roseomonas sp. CCTCC AB2023176 TaxID=3342640 RepID=UPI0035DFBEAC